MPPFRLARVAASATLLLVSAALAQPPAQPPAPTLAPNPAATPMTRTDAGWTARNDAFNARTKQARERGDIDVIFLGDSITQGWEGAGKAAWERTFAPLNAVNYGIGGDQTGHVLGRIASGNLDGLSTPAAGRPPRVVVLLIGTNNAGTQTPEQIAGGVKAIVERVQEKLPRAKVLLLAVFPRGQTPGDREGVTAKRANELLAKLADGERVRYLDIGPRLMESGAASPTAAQPADVSVADLSAWVSVAGEDCVFNKTGLLNAGFSYTPPDHSRIVRIGTSELHVVPGPPPPRNPSGPRLILVDRGSADGSFVAALLSATGSPLVPPVFARFDRDGDRDRDPARPENAEATREAIAPLWNFWTARFAERTLDRSIFPDLLHLSAKGYDVWAEAMGPVVQEMLEARD